MTTPLSAASRRARVKSLRCGAFPAPKVSRTTPRMGGAKNALTVSEEIPGKSRNVATEHISTSHSSAEFSADQLGNPKLLIHKNQIAIESKFRTFMSLKPSQARLSNHITPVYGNVDTDYTHGLWFIPKKARRWKDSPFTSGEKFGLVNASRSNDETFEHLFPRYRQ